MFYVIYGYCGPDNYTSNGGPILHVMGFRNEIELLSFHKSFVDGIGKDDSDVTFKIIEGKERKLEAVLKVTEYKLI